MEQICECGEAVGMQCANTVVDDAVTVEFMPECLRSSHEAAGNQGVYPFNGGERLRCHPDCADEIIEDNEGWAEILNQGDDT